MIVDIHGHRFEIYTLVSEIHENIDLVLGIKSVFELEGVTNTWDCCFSSLNRSLPIFSKRVYCAKSKRIEIDQGKSTIYRWYIRSSNYENIRWKHYSTMLLKLKFMHNATMLDIVNNGPDTIIFKLKEMLGILDLRSLGHYKIKQGIMQQNWSKYYKFKRSDSPYKHFNKFINTLKRRENRKNQKKTIHG